MKSNERYNLRVDLLRQMADLMNQWDGTADSAEEIISKNEKNIHELKKYEVNLDDDKSLFVNKTEKLLLENMIQKQKEMIEQIKIQHEKLVNQSKQLSQKDKVIKNYVSVALAPMFVDKGL